MDGQPVAVKIIRSIGTLSTMRRKIERERKVWERLDHPNILPFYGHADDPEFEPFGAFISPWCEHGDSNQYLERYGSSLSPFDRLQLWKGVVNGVVFLHTCSPVIIHADLKPGNIVIDDNGNARICDFGLVHITHEEGVNETTTTSEHTGTERYLAPEFLTTHLAKPTQASDVYAMALIGLVFIYGRIPYERHVKNFRGCIIMDIQNGVPPATREAIIGTASDPLWDMLEAGWGYRPESRPTSTEVLDYLWILDHPPNDSLTESPTSESSSQYLPLTPEENALFQSPVQEESDQPSRSQDNNHHEPERASTITQARHTMLARATLPYTAFDPEEISFNRGDILTIHDWSGTWWRASRADGQPGVVPSMYLTILSPQEEREFSQPSVQHGISPVSPEEELSRLYRRRAMSDYDAMADDPDQLSFQRGDILDILSDSGPWWRARKQDGTTGNVPPYFLEHL